MVMEIRDEMQKIALEWPTYGYRRMTIELQRRGFDVQYKRILRIMREDNLLCVRRRRFAGTTDSRHNLPVYPNLARSMKVTGINQPWVADITYIRLRSEFVFLAVVLDAFAQSDRLVLGTNPGSPTRNRGSAHGSDDSSASSGLGASLRSRRSVRLSRLHGHVRKHQAEISMSRKGNPDDNAACESFMKTLKYEEVYRLEYRDFHDVHASIGEFLERVYNERRLHPALGYVPPAEFESGETE